VEVPYTGTRIDPQDGGLVHVYADPETGVVVLDVNDASGDATTVRLAPEEAAILAVNLLRDRSMLVNGSG
jgi:hypothetical protein